MTPATAPLNQRKALSHWLASSGIAPNALRAALELFQSVSVNSNGQCNYDHINKKAFAGFYGGLRRLNVQWHSTIKKSNSHYVASNFWRASSCHNGPSGLTIIPRLTQPVGKYRRLQNLLGSLIVIGASLLAGCHRQTIAEPSSSIRFSACSPPNGHAPIPESDCAYISLPENPAEPSGTLVDIHFLRIKAVDAKPEHDPLVLIQGGPGGSSQLMAYSLHRFFSSVRLDRDLLFIDLRGTGRSNPLKCQGLEAISGELSDKDALNQYHSVMSECAKQYTTRAPYYSTATAAADLEQVRQRLGYRQLNIWAASYGTRVALYYARNFSAHTRSLVLDGLAPQSLALPRHIARDAMASFNRLNQFCQAQELCKQQYGNLLDNAHRINHRLSAVQEPVKITLPDPTNKIPREWRFTSRRFAQLLISILYSRELTSLAPRALKEAADGNYQLLGTLSALAETQGRQLDLADGFYYSIICNEDLTQPLPAQLPEPNFMGVDLVVDKSAVCAFWPKHAAPAQPRWEINFSASNLQNATPTLLLSGALDPVTPKSWADLVASTQIVHQIIEVPGGNHVVSTLGCMPNLIAQFINLPTARLPTQCSQSILPLPFYLGADSAGGTSD